MFSHPSFFCVVAEQDGRIIGSKVELIEDHTRVFECVSPLDGQLRNAREEVLEIRYIAPHEECSQWRTAASCLSRVCDVVSCEADSHLPGRGNTRRRSCRLEAGTHRMSRTDSQWRLEVHLFLPYPPYL